MTSGYTFAGAPHCTLAQAQIVLLSTLIVIFLMWWLTHVTFSLPFASWSQGFSSFRLSAAIHPSACLHFSARHHVVGLILSSEFLFLWGLLSVGPCSYPFPSCTTSRIIKWRDPSWHDCMCTRLVLKLQKRARLRVKQARLRVKLARLRVKTGQITSKTGQITSKTGQITSKNRPDYE